MSGQIDLARIAKEARTTVIEPTQGLQRFGGTLTIVGPSEDFYRQMLEAQVSGTAGVESALQKALREVRLAEKAVVSRIRQIVTGDPGETLTNSEGDTFPRNNTSVITLLQVDGKSLLLTGDAGVDAIATTASKHSDRWIVPAAWALASPTMARTDIAPLKLPPTATDTPTSTRFHAIW